MQQNIRVEQAEDILKGFKLPPRPTIFAELKKVSPDINKMAHVIEQDPAIAASILKVVNSPSIGIANKVTSISHAMSLLGLRSIMNIINAAFLKRTVQGYENTEQLDNFWQSTIKVAAGMAAITRQLNLQRAGVSVDDAYCLGLFHNVGMPMLLDKHEDYFNTIRPTYKTGGLLETENEHFNTNHTVLGFYMTKGWGLPTPITEVIKNHHNFEMMANLEQLDSDVATLLCVLKMSEQIAGEAEELGEVDFNIEWSQISSSITSFMGISTPDFFDLEDHVYDMIEAELAQSNE